MAGNQHILKKLIATSGERVLLPFYHAVAPSQPDHILPSMFQVRTPHQFEEDLKFLLTIGDAVSIRELRNIVAHGLKSKKPVFHVTFDDGLREYFEYAYPLLKQYGVPSTVLVNTDFVDNRDMFYRFKVALLLNRSEQPKAVEKRLLDADHNDIDWIQSLAVEAGIDFEAYLKEERPYLDMNELGSIAGGDVAVGSHSCDHRWFKYLSEDEMKDQVNRSFAWLKGRFDFDISAFSFPFSDEGVPASFLHWLHHGYGCDLSFGVSGLKTDVEAGHLHRLAMERSREPASKIVVREYLKCIARAPLGKNRILRR